MKVLILKPSSLGDIIQALPVLRLLKRHRPAAQVFWWVESSLTGLLQDDPDLSGVIPFERARWKHPWHWWELWQSVRALRNQAFDWVIDLQGLARSGLFGWLANGRVLIGVDDAREGAPCLYDYAVPRPSSNAHAVDWYLQTLSVLNVPVHDPFEWIPRRPAVAAAVRRKWPVEPVPWIILLPGARWDNKRWPIQSYAALLQQLAGRLPACRFAILGSAGDRAAARHLQEAVPDRTLDLTGQTSLPEMVEWIRLGALTVTNDTGPMHVAAALGKPVVALFGPTDPRRTGPYGQLQSVLRHELPCAPCLKDTCLWRRPLECLRGISVQEVFQRVLAQWNAAHPAEVRPRE